MGKHERAEEADSSHEHKESFHQEQKRRRREQIASATKRLLVTDLCGDLRAIYTRALKNSVPCLAHQSVDSSLEAKKKGGKKNKKKAFERNHEYDFGYKTLSVNQEMDGAMLIFPVHNQWEARECYKRLQNLKLYGRPLKVEYHPLRDTVPEGCTLFDTSLNRKKEKKEGANPIVSKPGKPIVVDVLFNVPVQPFFGNNQLVTVQGFLGLEPILKSHHNKELSAEDSGRFKHYAATFVDEGAALHACALLSGRSVGTVSVGQDVNSDTLEVSEAKIGFSEAKSVHMFLKIR